MMVLSRAVAVWALGCSGGMWQLQPCHRWHANLEPAVTTSNASAWFARIARKLQQTQMVDNFACCSLHACVARCDDDVTAVASSIAAAAAAGHLAA
jgi:hypothetical protein